MVLKILKRNVIANYIGQGWTAFLNLAFVPVYISYLGIEAYGLIGMFAVLQASLNILDMGLTPTIGREMARSTGGAYSRETIRDLLLSIEVVAFGASLLIALGLGVSAHWFANYWFSSGTVTENTISRAFQVMGVVIALRFMEGVYRSAIIGLQKQTLYNVTNSFLTTVRCLGAVGALALFSPTIDIFFMWQCLASILSVATLRFLSYTNLPLASRPAKFSSQALRNVSLFAGGMLGISSLSFLLTQIDKLMLSALLSQTEFGYYVFASTTAGAVFVFILPITQAFYPKFCELSAQQMSAELTKSFHLAAQLSSVIAGSVALVLMFFGDIFLELWTQDRNLAAQVAPVMTILVLGNLLNSIMHVPYNMQLAYGWTSLTVKVNSFACTVFIPLILILVPLYGSKGAAWIWVFLNIGYCVIAVHFMYQRIMPSEKARWYLRDVLAPLGTAALALSAVKILIPAPSNVYLQIATLILAAAIALISSGIAANHVRYFALHQLQIRIKKKDE